MARDRGSRGERWIAVHDGMPDHPKIENLSDRAFRALVTLWCYCGRYHTDGHISTKKWVQIASPSARRELLAAGLVETRSDGSVDMHDYLHWQRSATEVEQVVEAKRSAGQQGNHERWHVKKNRYDPDCKWCADNPPPPSQTASHMRSQTGSQTGRRGEERREEKDLSDLGAPAAVPNARGAAAAVEHVPPAELNATATRRGGYRLVTDWATRNPGATTSHRRALGKAVDALLASGANPAHIPRALDIAHEPRWRDPIRALPLAYEDARREATPTATPLAKQGTTGERVATILALKGPA